MKTLRVAILLVLAALSGFADRIPVPLIQTNGEFVFPDADTVWQMNFKTNASFAGTTTLGGPVVIGGVSRTNWSREEINVVDYGAVHNGADDVTIALNAAAAAARAQKKGLYLPPSRVAVYEDTFPPEYYRISGQVDFSEISQIRGDGALILMVGTTTNAVVIGSTNTTFMRADISLEVRHSLAGTSQNTNVVGVKVLNMSNSRLKVSARGFYYGVVFEGRTANRVWMGNRVEVGKFQNNASHFLFDMAGDSYHIKNDIIGGQFNHSSGTIFTNAGAIKLSLKGGSIVTDLTMDSPLVDITDDSWNSDGTQAIFVWADPSTTYQENAVTIKNARWEGYGSLSDTYGAGFYMPRFVYIGPGSGRVGVDIGIGGEGKGFRQDVYVPPGTAHKIRISAPSIRPQGELAYPQQIVPEPTTGYAVSNRLYVPNRLLVDGAIGYSVFTNTISHSVSSGYRIALGDGDIISADPGDSFGLMYQLNQNEYGQTLFAELQEPQQFVIVAYSTNGTVLTGTSPQYVMGEGITNVTASGSAGSVGVYRLNGRWFSLRPEVARFYIGPAAWSSGTKLRDVRFNVLAGAVITPVVDGLLRSAPGRVADQSPKQSFWPVGTVVLSETTNQLGWVNQKYVVSTLASNATSGASSVYSSAATSAEVGDTIAIAVDTMPVTGASNYVFGIVTNVSGSTISFTPALSDNASAGRRLLLNKWAMQQTGGSSTTDASLLTSGTLPDARLSSNVLALATNGATGTGAFVRQDSPTFTGTLNIPAMSIGMLTVISNLYTAISAYGAGWNNSSNAAARGDVYNAIEYLRTNSASALYVNASVATSIVDSARATWTVVGNQATAAAPFPRVTLLTNAGVSSYTVSSNALLVDVHIIAPGGAGGSGRRGLTNTVRCGGGGGASGAYSWARIPIGAFNGTYTVNVTNGAAGTGGGAVTTDSTDGTNGTAGAQSSFGNWVWAQGGGGGGAGTATSGAAGAAPTNYATVAGLIGGAASTSGGGGNKGSDVYTTSPFAQYMAGSGSSGGGLTVANAAGGGDRGGAASGAYYGLRGVGYGAATANPGQTGNDGTSLHPSLFVGGPGAGGGGAATNSPGGAGGNGGRYGGGGGGGAASNNGNLSGAGGSGGAGAILILEY